MQSLKTIYEEGDYIEFKNFTNGTINNDVLKGKIVSISDDLLEILKIYTPDNTCNYPGHYQNNKDHTDHGKYRDSRNYFDHYEHYEEIEKDEKTIWITASAVVRHYNSSIIKKLSPRLLLKEKWKNFIFREVKTIKAKDPYLITYHYINESGFIRTDKFKTLIEAQRSVPYELIENIQVHYRDYFGFTTDQIIRNNDAYSNQEIFFSKKCYSELNLNGEVITGEFTSRRGFKTIPPKAKQYVCGLVENGEKGLFYRKWFICSKEFLMLWTMICESDHFSLKIKKDGKYITKSLEDILNELDTSCYNFSDGSVNGYVSDYVFNNIENYALYVPDMYQRVVKALFCNETSDDNDLYDYNVKIRNDLMWFTQ